jgi:hypothetical protein
MLRFESNHAVAIALISLLVWLCNVLFTGYQQAFRHIPGPFLAKFTSFWRFRLVWSGTAHEKYRELHERYGPIVRIAPNVLVISDPAEIATIYDISSKFLKVLELSRSEGQFD